jgi:hypothetical protein
MHPMVTALVIDALDAIGDRQGPPRPRPPIRRRPLLVEPGLEG